MRCEMRKPCEVKVRCYAAPMIQLNEYLAALPEANESDKIGETEYNKIILDSIPNGWSKQAYVQGFDYEYIT